MALFASRCGRIGTENAFKIGPLIRALEETGKRVIKCNLGEPDFPLPAHIRDEVKRQLDADNTHYCDPQGLPSLRRAVARHLSETRAIRIGPEQVVVFPGGKPPIGLCQQAYLDPGDAVVYPSPGYPIYESFIEYFDGRPLPLHLREERGFALTADDLVPLLGRRTKLLVLNFPSNPTGCVATAEQLAELAAVIRRRAPADLRIYSDEIYEDIVYDGARHLSIASQPGMMARTIIVSGVSKSYAWTGGRIGWAAFPTVEEAELFRNLNINYFSCVAPFSQEGARAALESPESRRSIAAMVAAFQERRDLVVAGLEAIPGVRCRRPGGAFYAFPNVAGVCERLGAIAAHAALPVAAGARSSPATLLQRFLLLRHQVATLDRRSFGVHGAAGEHYLRLSFATGLDDLREALRRIARAAEDRAGFADFFAEEARRAAA
jgi:aspartate/methionine/tyrosine aminotransferase